MVQDRFKLLQIQLRNTPSGMGIDDAGIAYPSGVESRLMHDFLNDQYRHVTNETGGQVPHDTVSLVALYERLMKYLARILEEAHGLGSNNSMIIMDDIVWSIKTRAGGIFLQCTKLDSVLSGPSRHEPVVSSYSAQSLIRSWIHSMLFSYKT
jgi:hypothetical protein